MRAIRGLLVAIAVAFAASLSTPAPTPAAIPAAATYQATITGAVYEWSALAGGYQQTAQVDLPALLFVEPRRIAPQPTSPVVGLFTGGTPALDNRPGAINFATNTQGFHVNPNVVGPTLAAIDVATVQADPAAGVLRTQVDTNAARTVTVELFRTSASLVSTPAQILSGTLGLQFGSDGTTVTGSFDLGGNGLIEPGNPLFPVRRYAANISGQATSITPAPVAGGGQAPGAAGGAALDSVRAPARGIAGAGRKGIAVTLSCTSACNARARLSISRRTARRARLRRTSVGSATASRQTPGPLTLRVKLSRRARPALRRLRRVRVLVSVTVTTADGVKHPFRKRLTLKR